jgi:hypothetical protein
LRKEVVNVENIDLRIKKGSLTYEEIGEKAGIHANTVYKWFNKTGLGEVERQRLMIAIDEIKEGK